MSKPIWKLCSWIPEGVLNPFTLSSNPRAIDLIREKIQAYHDVIIREEKKSFEDLVPEFEFRDYSSSKMPVDREHLSDFLGLFDWKTLSEMPEAIQLLTENVQRSRLDQNDPYFEPMLVRYLDLRTNQAAIPLMFDILDAGLCDFSDINITFPEAEEGILHREMKIPRATFISLLSRGKTSRSMKIIEDHIRRSKLPRDHPDFEQEMVHWRYLFSNPAAIHIIEENLHRNDGWEYLSSNPAAIHLLQENLRRSFLPKEDPEYEQIKFSYYMLSLNPNAYDIFTKAIELTKDTQEKRNIMSWFCMSDISPSLKMPFIEKNLDISDWDQISAIPEAMHLLEENLRRSQLNPPQEMKIDWTEVSRLPEAINLIQWDLERIEKNPNSYIHIDWHLVDANPGAISIVKKLVESGNVYDYDYVSKNPGIFCIDYEKMKKKMHNFKREIVEEAMCTRRVLRILLEAEKEGKNVDYDVVF